jgi:aspartate carbamoyltransferase catalytic subunit
MSGLLKVTDLQRSSIDGLLAAARGHLDGGRSEALAGAIVALVFAEDSVRTRVGFDVAAARLGARTTTAFGPKHTSRMSSQESLEDLTRCLEPGCDVICLRHHDRTAPQRAAAAVATPIVNCGNGDDEHPTQALVDIFAIDALRGEVDGVSIAIVGDLRHMRAAHSLLAGLSRFEGVRARCVSPPELAMPEPYATQFSAAGNELEQTTQMDVGNVEIVYMTGLPADTPHGHLSKEIRARYRLDRRGLEDLAPGARVLCPLPRVDEIDPDVDTTPFAAYFQQNALGLAMRMAILEHVAAPGENGSRHG